MQIHNKIDTVTDASNTEACPVRAGLKMSSSPSIKLPKCNCLFYNRQALVSTRIFLNITEHISMLQEAGFCLCVFYSEYLAGNILVVEISVLMSMSGCLFCVWYKR